MNKPIIGHNRPVVDHVHPAIRKAIIGLALIFVLSAWIFAGDSYVGYLLAVVSGFVFMAVALPYKLWRAWRGSDVGAQAQDSNERFTDWASREFETWQYRTTGAHAAAEILLPIAAVALGMTAFAIVSLFT